jgi:hypothetical protein
MSILLDGALMLGVAAVVPFGASVHPHLVSRAMRGAAACAGLVAAVGVLAGSGPVAGALVLPLAAWTVTAGVRSLWAWWRSPSWPGLAPVVAIGYLGVGVTWLGAHLLELRPAGFGPPFVALTAIHFLYAGFAATLIASRIHDRAAGRYPRTSAAGLVATASGPPLVGAGFALYGPLQVAGALVLTVGLYLIAALMLVAVAPRTAGRARWLLTLAAIAVVGPMLLAVHWAAGTTIGFATLSIPTMARTHGVVNALGFVLPALIGLRLLGSADPLVPSAGQDRPFSVGPSAPEGRRGWSEEVR